MNNVFKLAISLALGAALSLVALAQEPAAQSVRKAGTVKAINGNVITLQPDSGDAIQITVPEGARIRRLEAGQTDLKSAPTITLQEIQVGDRMLAAARPGDQGALTASSVVIMKQSDVAQKQQKDMQDWQRRGAGGIVSAIDSANGTITVSVTPANSVLVKTSKDTGFLRYAPNSIKFADAQKGAFDQIKTGDQLRARGTKSADGKEIAADEVISGTFRNIAGTVSSVDAEHNTITVKDVLAKKSVVVKLTGDSQMRKLPPEVAQQIAARLRRASAGQPGATGTGAPGTGAPASAPSAGPGGMPGGAGRPAPDFQQIVNRQPAITVADLHKEDAVMIVSTAGTGNSEVSAITLLSGVEPILTASPNAAGAAALLSGWNLSAPGEGGGGPQ